MDYALTFAWFLLVLVVAFCADRFWGALLGRIYWVFIAPAVAVHELSHAVACLLTFAKVRKVRLFGAGGGSVEHAPSKIPVVGQTIISLAPIAGCSAVLALIGWLLKWPVAYGVKRVPMKVGTSDWSIKLFLNDVYDAVTGLGRALWRANYSEWRTWLFIYAVVALGIAMRPSREDMRHAVAGLVGFGLAAFGVDWLLNRWGYGKPVLSVAQYPLNYLVTFMCLVALLTLAAWALRALLRWAIGKHATPTKSAAPASKSTK
ncbi:MAG TPA: hypothetical protein P5137_00605 [Candidatus Brocadiia bacterium]|nr:hypothetical protein [Candidatus Brocadiia bacterium]